MARRKRRPAVIKSKKATPIGSHEPNHELPMGSVKQKKDKKVVKTIHFEKSDVDGLTVMAEELGLTFSAYLRMVAKKHLKSIPM